MLGLDDLSLRKTGGPEERGGGVGAPGRKGGRVAY